MPRKCKYCSFGKGPQSAHFNRCPGEASVKLRFNGPDGTLTQVAGFLIRKSGGVGFCCVCQGCAVRLKAQHDAGAPLIFKSYSHKGGLQHHFKEVLQEEGGNNWNDRQSLEVCAPVRPSRTCIDCLPGICWLPTSGDI